jgi:hypothetical protein
MQIEHRTSQAGARRARSRRLCSVSGLETGTASAGTRSGTSKTTKEHSFGKTTTSSLDLDMRDDQPFEMIVRSLAWGYATEPDVYERFPIGASLRNEIHKISRGCLVEFWIIQEPANMMCVRNVVNDDCMQ